MVNVFWSRYRAMRTLEMYQNLFCHRTNYLRRGQEIPETSSEKTVYRHFVRDQNGPNSGGSEDLVGFS